MRVILYGSSLLMRGIEASLKAQPGLEWVSLPTNPSELREQASLLQPDAVVVEAGTVPDELSMALLREVQGLALVTLDPECSRVRVLSDHQSQAATMKELVRVIETGRKDYRPNTRWNHRAGNVDNNRFIKAEGEFKMKNLNKRSTIILAIVGLVVVAVVAIVVFTPVGGGDLLGTAVLAITPANPTFVVGSSTGLSVNAVYNCAWSSSNTAVASLVNYAGETKAVRVKANAPGSATITAKCGFGAINANSVSTTFTVLDVLAIAPANPSVILGNTIALSVPAGYNCTWTNSGGASFVGANTGSRVTVRGDTAGQAATITAQCGTWGSTSTSVAVNNLVFSPDKIVHLSGSLVKVDGPTGSIYPCTWTTSSPDVAFMVNNQLTTAPQERAYVVWLYFHSQPMTGSIASITISCGAGQSAILKAKSCWPGDAACLNDKSF